MATSVRSFSAPATEWIASGSFVSAVAAARCRNSMALRMAVGKPSAQSFSASAIL